MGIAVGFTPEQVGILIDAVEAKNIQEVSVDQSAPIPLTELQKLASSSCML